MWSYGRKHDGSLCHIDVKRACVSAFKLPTAMRMTGKQRGVFPGAGKNNAWKLLRRYSTKRALSDSLDVCSKGLISRFACI